MYKSNDASAIHNLVFYCNTRINRTNDYNMARVALEHAAEARNISQEDFAELADVSVSSVSRFISKIGFDSYPEFCANIVQSTMRMNLTRTNDYTRKFLNQDVEQIADNLYQNLIENLQATRQSLDISALQKITRWIYEANSISFFGDESCQNRFILLQLDLLSSGRKCYAFQAEEIQYQHMNTLGKGDLAIFPSVQRSFSQQLYEKLLSMARSKGVRVIVFAQDEFTFWQQWADTVIPFGREGDSSIGFHSLLYICWLLSELFYRETDNRQNRS